MFWILCKPPILTWTHWKKLAVKFRRLWNSEFQCFPLEEALDWDVYLLSKLFGHYSMAFKLPGSTAEGILVHLQVENGQTILALDKIDLAELQEKHSKIKQTRLGQVHYKALDIVKKAFSKLQKMGTYHATFNNCQDYCQELAETFDINTITTDSDRVMAAAGTAAVGLAGIGIAAALYKLFKSTSEDNK